MGAGAARTAEGEILLGAGAGAGEQIQLPRLTRHGREAAIALHQQAFLGLKALGCEHLGKAHALVLQLFQIALAPRFFFLVAKKTHRVCSFLFSAY